MFSCRKLPVCLLSLVFLLFFSLASPSHGAVLHVKADAGGENNGSSWADAYTSLQSALAAAHSGDEIWVAEGSYKPHESDREASFELKNGVTLYGGFPETGNPSMEDRDPAAYPTILTGNIGDPGNHDDNSYHVVYAENVTNAVLDGFTITGGRANGSGDQYGKGSGGGMYATGGSPTVRNCIFTANFALFYGGGMYNTASSPAVTNCTFSENRAAHGGGMHNYVESSPTVTNCTFTGNIASDGGGMQNHSNSDPTVTNCTFTGNSAEYGGGGGMNNYWSGPTVTNCTFSGNTASYGGGMSNEDSSPTVKNSIFWASSGGEIFDDGTSAPSFSFCVVQGGYEGGTEILTGDPKLGPLADNGGPTQTHALLAGSSALDAGRPVGTAVSGSVTVPAADQRGITRPQGEVSDIGAFEAVLGELQVSIQPEAARTAGAQWSADGGSTWKNSGDTEEAIPTGTCTITFNEVTGWTKPDDQAVAVTKDATVTVEKTYVRHTGNVRVNITGPSGARWSIDGTEWKNSGQTITGLPTGVYTVLFNEVTGWTKPANRNATINKDQLTVADVQYTVIPAPDPDPAPAPARPVNPPVVPPSEPLPSGSAPSMPAPLAVNLPPSPTPEQEREALAAVLQDAGIPGGLAEDMASLLNIDGEGNVSISGDGMDRLRELLETVEIPEGAERISLPVFQAPLTGGATTAAVFFAIPGGFLGKRCDSLQVVKMFSSTEADVFHRVHSLDALLDGCSAVVEVEGETLVRVLGAGDAVTANCRLALAIRDGGRFDLDGEENGSVTDPAFMVEGEAFSDPDDPQRSGGGGCSAGGALAPSLVMLLAPLALLAAGRKR